MAERDVLRDVATGAAVGTVTAGGSYLIHREWMRRATEVVVDGKRARFEKVDPSKIVADPDTFQFKTGGDAKGVTDRLRGVTKWDPVAAGKAVVYERRDGTRVIADGHQRLGLAQRLGADDPNLRLDAYVMREADGWTPRDVRVYAAIKNMKESSGNSLDMARVIRERPSLVDGSLPISDGKLREARNLAKLSDPAFRMVAGGAAAPEVAAAVAEALPDPARHADLLTEMVEAKVGTAQHARLYAQQAMATASIAEETGSLFGTEMRQRSLVRERAAVLDRAITDLRQDKRLFGLLDREAATIEDAGNKLAKSVNAARAGDAGKTVELVEKLATTRGTLSSMLDDAAKAVAAGEKPAVAARRFTSEVSRIMRTGGVAALAADGVATIADAADDMAKAPKTLPGQTSFLPGPTTRELIEAQSKQLAQMGGIEPMDVGMFGDAAKQTDLVDMAKGPAGWSDEARAAAAEARSAMTQYTKDEQRWIGRMRASDSTRTDAELVADYRARKAAAKSSAGNRQPAAAPGMTPKQRKAFTAPLDHPLRKAAQEARYSANLTARVAASNRGMAPSLAEDLWRTMTLPGQIDTILGGDMPDASSNRRVADEIATKNTKAAAAEKALADYEKGVRSGKINPDGSPGPKASAGKAKAPKSAKAQRTVSILANNPYAGSTRAPSGSAVLDGTPGPKAKAAVRKEARALGLKVPRGESASDTAARVERAKSKGVVTSGLKVNEGNFYPESMSTAQRNKGGPIGFQNAANQAAAQEARVASTAAGSAADAASVHQSRVAAVKQAFKAALGGDEKPLKAQLAALAKDKTLKAADIESIAKDAGVIRTTGKGKKAAIEAIDKHRVWLTYNRDADIMAAAAGRANQVDGNVPKVNQADIDGTNAQYMKRIDDAGRRTGGPIGFQNAANQAAAQEALADMRGAPAAADDAAKAAKGGVKAAAGKVAKAASKGLGAVAPYILPAVAIGAGLTAYNRSAEAGESTGTALGKAGYDATDVVTSGALSTYEDLKTKTTSDGERVFSDESAAALATLKGVADTLAFGGVSLIEGAASLAAANPEDIVKDHRAAARDANAAAAEKIIAAGGKPTKAQMMALEAKRADGGDAVDTAAGVALGAGVAAAGVGMLKRAADKSLMSPQTIGSRLKNAGRVGLGVAALAGGTAMVVGAVTGGAKADDGGVGSVENTAWRNMQDRLQRSGDPAYRQYQADVQAIENGTAAPGVAERVAQQTAAYKRQAVSPGEMAKPGREAISKARTMLAKVDAARTVNAVTTTSVQVGQIAKGGTRAYAKQEAEKPKSDGFAEGYVRQQGGKTVQVQGYHIQPRRAR